jgi:hypothetical protein
MTHTYMYICTHTCIRAYIPMPSWPGISRSVNVTKKSESKSESLTSDDPKSISDLKNVRVNAPVCVYMYVCMYVCMQVGVCVSGSLSP